MNQLFMIHPEFEDENGNVVLYNDRSVPIEGTALMWILTPQLRAYHYERIGVGTKGYFQEGGTRVAEAYVIKILGLGTNPKV